MSADGTDSADQSVHFDHAAEAAGALDLLLSDAARGGLRRFAPDAATAHLVLQLARRPLAVGRRGGWLAAELGKVLAGRSQLAANHRDRRFAEPAWRENPLLRRALQAYLASGQAAGGLLDDADLSWRDNERLQFLLLNLIAAAAPSNNPLMSPAAWKSFIDTGGRSAVRGVRALVSDMSASPRVPTMVTPDAFTVGADLAVSPGAVISRSEVCEVIQYGPATPKVRRYPVLIVPPTINKFYIADLAPGRSLIEFLIGQGLQVFTISWRNPDARHRHWNLDTYGRAIVDALGTVRQICKAAKASICAFCSGGILTSMVSAHLSATGQADQLASIYLGVTVLDQSHAGTAAAMISPRTAAAAAAASRSRGYLDGRMLAEVFAWLRPDDLVWRYWVNNYLQGKPPAAFDILYWNADTTRMPAALHHDFLQLAISNALTRAGAATMLGSPVDLSKVDVDSYLMAGVADHLCAWQSCYRSTQLLGGSSRFVLSTSGHIASIINPPTNPKSTFRTAAGNPDDPDEWQAQAMTAQGSWWPDYASWLTARSGGLKQARRSLGSAAYPPTEQAPGTYVLHR